MTRKRIPSHRRLLRVRPWVAVAVSLSVALTAYYGLLGARYWTASAQVEAADVEVRQVISALRRDVDEGDVGGDTPGTQQQRMEDLDRVFSYPRRDRLVAQVTAVARAVPVDLAALTLGEPQSLVKNGVSYRLQPMTIAVQGDMADLDRFLARLHEAVPVVAVSSIRVANLDGVATANIELFFHLSPRVVPAEGREGDQGGV